MFNFSDAPSTPYLSSLELHQGREEIHELLSRWPQHERHVELLERQNYLEQEIAKLEWNSDDDFSIVTERM
ncbi:hypothetical protein CRE_08086 [Caenorhabditis remanei]|uniref:Uncharacterized protein n=1 Tax=Caenorhabditis remanei TaxID=31234 RepID=E3M3B3_CAERE|nr:hypothetical protein CRE_08086 [Caenorhabditis remanei]